MFTLFFEKMFCSAKCCCDPLFYNGLYGFTLDFKLKSSYYEIGVLSLVYCETKRYNKKMCCSAKCCCDPLFYNGLYEFTLDFKIIYLFVEQ